MADKFAHIGLLRESSGNPPKGNVDGSSVNKSKSDACSVVPISLAAE